jgi:hypothetical protein
MKRTASTLGWVLLVATLLVSAGCTGTDFLSSNQNHLIFEVVLNEENATVDFECINMRLGNVRVKPLDGTCSAGSANPGEPCLAVEDCPGGTCDGSGASEVITVPISLNEGQGSVIGNLKGTVCDFDAPVGLSPSLAQPFEQPAPLLLTEGVYVLDRLRMEDLQMYDDDTSTYYFCETATLSLHNAFGPGLRFTVPGDGEKQLRIVANIDVWQQEIDTVGASDCSITGTLTTAFSCPDCDAAP